MRLNLRPEHQSLCHRTIERYIKLFRDDELAQNIMRDVTAELVTLLELDVSKQRLDSTHLESNMARFGRIRLMLLRVFEQQREVTGNKVTLKKKSVGDIICNPSDPGATYDRHKDSGYQVQLSETCSDANDVQLIIAAIPETACEPDSKAIARVLDHFDEHGHRPESRPFS